MMNLKFLAVALTSTLFCGFCQAQTNAEGVKEDFKPSTINQPSKEFPQVNSQGYARFRIKAPNQIAVE